MRKLILALAALAALAIPATLSTPSFAHEQKFGDLVLHHAWARATPAGAKTGAVYVRIENHGMAEDKLIGVASDIAAKVEVHNMTMENNTMVMGPAGDLVIPMHGMIELAPHGLHIMLMGLKKPLAEGDTFAVTLTFEEAGSVDLQVVVEAIGSEGGHDGDEGGEEHSH
jgi:copper(I)-binding protein